jgi:hypothetical protein
MMPMRCRWPRNAEEWKALLSKAAPWLAAAAIVAAIGAAQRGDGSTVRGKARRAGDRAAGAAEDAADSARRGWFGLKVGVEL